MGAALVVTVATGVDYLATGYRVFTEGRAARKAGNSAPEKD